MLTGADTAALRSAGDELAHRLEHAVTAVLTAREATTRCNARAEADLRVPVAVLDTSARAMVGIGSRIEHLARVAMTLVAADRDAVLRADVLGRRDDLLATAAARGGPSGALARLADSLEALLGADLIMDFDAAGDGLAVAAFGDPSAAPHVAIVVPGIGNDLGNVARLLANAAALQRAGGLGVATIAWLGYDTPGRPGSLDFLGNAWRGGRARAWADELSSFVREVRAGAAAGATVTVVAHSYGGRLAAEAARGPGLDVDDLVLLGVPGLGVGVDAVADLGLDPDRVTVWAEATGDPAVHDGLDALAGPWRHVLRGFGIDLGELLGVSTVLGRLATGGDPIPYLPSWHGADPERAAFGACGFDVGGARGHSQYFAGASLASLAAIVAGRTPRADEDRHADPSDPACWR